MVYFGCISSDYFMHGIFVVSKYVISLFTQQVLDGWMDGWMEWAVYRTDPALAPAHASTRVPRQKIWLRVGVNHRSALSLPLVSRQCYPLVAESPST